MFRVPIFWVLIALLITVGVCLAVSEPPENLAPSPPRHPAPPRSAPPVPHKPVTTKKVGEIKYTGQHTWKGVIEVDVDDIIIQDGTISAQVSGVPEGITFNGNRRGVRLQNLTFQGIGNGITVANNQTVDDVVIENCKFLECRSPDASSKDLLLGARGYGIYAAGGKNWTIRDTAFTTKPHNPPNSEQKDGSSQYACRLGGIHGLNVKSTRFENWAGKACVWLMYVRAASFDKAHFEGGPVRIGVRPNDMPGVEAGDCRNIIFRNCTFKFGIFDNWPAAILIFPGSENILFENCQITTDPESKWWLEVDERKTSNIRWKKCTWNGKSVEGYDGVRSSMSIDQMRSHNVGPAE